MSTISNSVNRTIRVLMTSRNIIIMSCCLIATGYILMSGDGSTEKSFEPDIFSVRRIVVAPIVCLAGYLLIVVGILRRKA
jgi:hypothetical protein